MQVSSATTSILVGDDDDDDDDFVAKPARPTKQRKTVTEEPEQVDDEEALALSILEGDADEDAADDDEEEDEEAAALALLEGSDDDDDTAAGGGAAAAVDPATPKKKVCLHTSLMVNIVFTQNLFSPLLHPHSIKCCSDIDNMINLDISSFSTYILSTQRHTLTIFNLCILVQLLPELRVLNKFLLLRRVHRCTTSTSSHALRLHTRSWPMARRQRVHRRIRRRNHL